MEKSSNYKHILSVIKNVGMGGLLLLLTAGSAEAAEDYPLVITPEYHSSWAGQTATEQKMVTIPPDYHRNKPQPLMRGEGFNYDLYYNYRLTPHIILAPNLQPTTKPGAVTDDSQSFVGGLSADIHF